MSSARSAFLPMDLDAAMAAEPDWRDRLMFPLAHPLTRDMDFPFREPFLDLLETRGDADVRDTALHAAPRLWAMSLGLYEQALMVQEARRLGLPCEGGPPETFELLGLPRPESGAHTGHTAAYPGAVPHAFARRLARTKSWTPAWKLPLTMLAPQVMALSHNTLLIDEAARSPNRIEFRHADTFVDDWGAAAIPSGLSNGLRDFARVTADLIATGSGLLDGDMSDLLRDMLVPRAEEILRHSAHAVLATRALRTFPKAIWAGSGGQFSARAIRLEAKRRGRPITSFDHGGTTAMVDEPFGATMLEYAVTDQYVMPTSRALPAMKKRERLYGARFGGARTTAGAGDTSFSREAMPPRGDRATRATDGKNVVLIMSPFIGPWQRLRTRQHDVVKLEWQFRLTEMLRRMPIDLLCQPHPEGALPGRFHPIRSIAKVSGDRFEAVAGWADVIVTDMVMSTTLWRAACMDIPVVLIDLDMAPFNPVTKPMIDKRFRIVSASYSARNLPEVDAEALRAAIAPPFSSEEADAAADFRTFLGGDTATSENEY
jgi:hypothetical protein